MHTMRFDVFGKMEIEVVRDGPRWLVFRLGHEGKKRLFNDMNIPSELQPSELREYMEDILHEWASPKHQNIVEIPKAQ